jgi:glycosyltransferase involved in cell wall biosynthesis
MSPAVSRAATIPMPVAAARPFRTASHLRVLLVCDSLGIGGAERQVIGLAAALKRRGHDVTIACSTHGELDGDARGAGIEVCAIADGLVKRRVSLAYSRLLTGLVSRGRFDVVHAHMHASAAAGAIACTHSGVPLVITEHSEATWRDQRAWRTSRSAYRRAAHVIAVSHGIARRLIEIDGVASWRVTAIRNAIATLGPGPNAASLRGVLHGEPIIGAVARLVPEKGISCFIRAAATVARQLPNAAFVVIGDGPLSAELMALAHSLRIAPRIHFLGARRDGPQLIAALDVLAVPSLSEGTPLVTLEALSAGVAVVASAVGGIPEQLRGFPHAALVPAGDSAALARALVQMVRAVGRSSSPRAGRIALLPGHEAMVRRTEAVYALVAAEARQYLMARDGVAMGMWPAR